CHPAPGPPHSVSLSSSLAVVRLKVEFIGHTAHAGLSPWEANEPTHRIHGIFEGKDWAPNIIPDNSAMYWYVRAPTTKEALETTERVKACFRAAAIATGCNLEISEGSIGNELVQIQSSACAELADVVRKKYGTIDYEWGIASASTDFVTIPSVPNGGNHTPAFTEAASSIEAHEACLDVSKALAAVGMRALTDRSFLSKVKLAYEEAKMARSG
ncbi:hypothetical protein EDD15DRAFT_2262715, partial [Pisolithus albus]